MNKKIQRIIWNPQPRQVLMMSKTEFEALYGGAAGGGKSDYLLAEALRQVHIFFFCEMRKLIKPYKIKMPALVF